MSSLTIRRIAVACAAVLIGLVALLRFDGDDPSSSKRSQEAERLELLLARLKVGQYCLKRRRGVGSAMLGREAVGAAARIREAAESQPSARVGDQSRRLLLSDVIETLANDCDPGLARELRESLKQIPPS